MSIVKNRKASHNYFIEERFEAGLVLEGWEVKAIRDGKVQLTDSYVKVKNGEVWLLGCHISPSISTSTHVRADSERLKKLLLAKKEISRLIGSVERKGYSIVALDLHFKHGKIKAEIALAKGKKLYDKRASEKEKELKLDKSMALKKYSRL